MKIADITPYIILALSVAAGRWGAKRATEIQQKAARSTNLGDVLDPAKRGEIKAALPAQVEEWFRRLDNGLGVFLIASAASAVQSNHPAAYALSAFFLMPAIAPAITSDAPNYLWALREKKNRSVFESYFYDYIRNTYYGKNVRKPFLFWLGYVALMVPLIQQVLQIALPGR